jgi:hypothetical protein
MTASAPGVAAAGKVEAISFQFNIAITYLNV